ncbi:hypothetical protein KDH_75260 [Dictyobacter sp. S3.2.2.5]|uniref:histidine kinase n=1 Tax=Dictyobacter halimunensis TaxID=3026934 RepID=A0ABQ6G7U0_9CHLR|nr:hypothetical protein KDH_75260 [Dictyobacter sp. S3.2.2.5]
MGYLLSPVWVGFMTLAALFIDEPLLIWIPFCILTLMSCFLWGIGPALLSMTLALFTLYYIIIPDQRLFAHNIWKDIHLLGPFFFVQMVITLLAASNTRQYRRTVAVTKELRAALRDLSALNRELTRTQRQEYMFFMRAAHELRTPLTTILGETQLALRRLERARPLPSESATCLAHFEHIEKRAQGLHALVEDLIELYHVQEEINPPTLSPCNVSDICTELTMQQHQLSGRGFKLELPHEPVIVQANKERFHSALTNIIDNADRYASLSTPICVCVHADANNACIYVHNEGAELSAEQQEHIFEPFYRTPTAERTYQSGRGLGLTISKAYIEQYGGSIMVKSPPGEGVTFLIELPIQKITS